MKVAIVLTFLLVAAFAHFEDVKSIVKNDECAASSLEVLKPQIEAQIKELKQVISNFILEPRKPPS